MLIGYKLRSSLINYYSILYWEIILLLAMLINQSMCSVFLFFWVGGFLGSAPAGITVTQLEQIQPSC